MYFPTAIAHQPGINAAVAEIAHELSPAVLHIRYEIGQDWSGDSAIFFGWCFRTKRAIPTP